MGKGVQHGFGVAVGLKAATELLQLITEFVVVIQFAVVGDNEMVVMTGRSGGGGADYHRLLAVLGILYGEAAVGEGDIIVQPQSRIIRTASGEPIAHTTYRVLSYGKLPSPNGGESEYAAHVAGGSWAIFRG